MGWLVRGQDGSLINGGQRSRLGVLFAVDCVGCLMIVGIDGGWKRLCPSIHANWVGPLGRTFFCEGGLRKYIGTYTPTYLVCAQVHTCLQVRPYF